MRQSKKAWPFTDPPNIAVFTSSRILDGNEWVYYVTHDQDDGAWQFHPESGPTPEKEARVVSLGTILEIDPTIAQLFDLQRGWCAWREEKEKPWQYSKTAT